MDLSIEFSNPYLRSQLDQLLTLALPPGAVVVARTKPRETALDDVVDADTDEIHQVSISPFTTMAELVAFLDSAPVGFHIRISRMTYG